MIQISKNKCQITHLTWRVIWHLFSESFSFWFKSPKISAKSISWASSPGEGFGTFFFGDLIQSEKTFWKKVPNHSSGEDTQVRWVIWHLILEIWIKIFFKKNLSTFKFNTNYFSSKKETQFRQRQRRNRGGRTQCQKVKVWYGILS